MTLSGIAISANPEQSPNAWLPMFVTLFGIETDFKPEQPTNERLSMRDTPSGTVNEKLEGTMKLLFDEKRIPHFGLAVTFVKPEHPAKAFWEMFVTPDGIVISPKLVHFKNAWVPMLLTLSGIVTAGSWEQFENE